MKKCNQPIKEQNIIYQKINDSTQFYKDKLGRTHATISLLQGENVGLFAKIKTKDSTIIELQKLVANNKTNLSNGGNAVIIHTTDTIIKYTKTDVFPLKDSCNPEYKTSYKDKWLDYDIVATKDTTKLGLKLSNEYSVIIGEKRKNIFSKKETFVDVVNDNPYDKIKTIRAYQVEDKTKNQKLIIGLQGGYGVGLNGKSLVLTPFIGIGITYKLFGL